MYTSLGTQQIGAMDLLREPNGDLVAAMTASTGTTLHLELIGYDANGSPEQFIRQRRHRQFAAVP